MKSPDTMQGLEEEIHRAIVEHSLYGSDDINVVIGPLVMRDPKAGRYFTISTSERERGWRVDAIHVEGEIDRMKIIAAFCARRPLVIHDTDDELYAARLCEVLWPGKRISQVRAAIEKERAAAEEHDP